MRTNSDDITWREPTIGGISVAHIHDWARRRGCRDVSRSQDSLVARISHETGYWAIKRTAKRVPGGNPSLGGSPLRVCAIKRGMSEDPCAFGGRQRVWQVEALAGLEGCGMGMLCGDAINELGWYWRAGAEGSEERKTLERTSSHTCRRMMGKEPMTQTPYSTTYFGASPNEHSNAGEENESEGPALA